MFNNSNILVTGGTGTFGKNFINFILKNYKPKKLSVFSRDEMKQFEMREAYNKQKNLSFIVGDVRDESRLNFSLRDVDYVVHAAAMKIVPSAEYNPTECIQTNINGSINVINQSILNNVKKVVALSTDKASSPINLYGATKLVSDKLFCASNLTDKSNTKFSVVRYGNVLGSRGSILPYLQSLIKNEYLPITDVKMTRFIITIDQAVTLVINAFKDSLGGEIYVKKIPSIKIVDLARAIYPKKKIKIIGIRPGEKIHEEMISIEDSTFTFEYKDYYKIIPDIFKDNINKYVKNGKRVKKLFCYESNNNKDFLKIEEIKKLIKNYEIII